MALKSSLHNVWVKSWSQKAGEEGMSPPPFESRPAPDRISRRTTCRVRRTFSWPRHGVVHALLQMAYLISKTDCSRWPEGPLAAITWPFWHPASVFSCHLGRENRPKRASACLIRWRCAASPTCLGSTTDLYSPGAVRPRYCGILRRLRARVPACGGSRTGRNSAA